MKFAWDIFTALLLIILSDECRANLPPLFSMDMNNLVIPENTPVGSVIYKLEGSDPERSPVRFDLQGTDVLKVNPVTGDVTVVKPLDYETNGTLDVVVSIEDEVQGGRNNIVQVPITVIVLDENDNAPNFEDAPYEILVQEDTPIDYTIFSKINVSDKDSSGANLEVECINLPEYQSACEYFDIETLEAAQNSYSGAIVLKKKLNYTTQQTYQFLLKATDGELSSTTNVTVNVGDVQDTPPRFIGDLKAEVDENAPINTLIVTVHAEDGDKGVPRKIVYELINNPMNYFLLDAITGELRTARPLDKEAVDNPQGIITLNIKAHELVDGVKSNDPLTVTNAEATIKIRDVNDEPPAFNKREYVIQVPENIPEGSPLPGLDMVVTDPDEGNNSAFSLQLTDISGAFSIEPQTALGSTSVTIRVANSSLDYEDLNQRKFIMLAVAKELYTEEHLSSTATITITVTDVNDNAPTFDQETYSATISEMASPGTPVITITAKDRDSGNFGENGIIYHLSGSGSDKFEVNNKTGTVIVAECETPGTEPCLDFEEKSEYQLQFIATDDDGKGQTKIVPLKVLLTDSNDNPPVFSQSIYRVFINEGAVKFYPDLIVEARDADKTSHVTYSIISGNDENLFSIEPNLGKIRIVSNKGLDVSNDTDNIIVLTVMASDGKFTATSVVNITIKDINNNYPIFTKESYVESVTEDTPIGSSIASVEATDLDTGLNALIEYQIQRGAYDDFSIDNATGVVTVASKLDFDRRNTYNIEVIARDHGEPSPLTGTATLTVNIVNTNDKLPYFTPTTQKAEIMEDAPIGAVVHTLIALDPDVNSSEALNFAAAEPITALDKHGNEVLDSDFFKSFFSVDKYTGKVTVVAALQRDVAAVIRITVLVTDITAPTVQQGEGLLIITITDVNDSPPTFLPPWTVEKPVYHLEIKEEQPVGTIVSTYKAFDEDSDIAGYVIIPESEYFEINNGTGIVQIKKQVDYEETKNLNFTVFAFDTGKPQLNSSATVLVNVININDNDPIFSAKRYNATVEENSPNGTYVLSTKAKDLDLGDFGKVMYSLTGEHSENFRINPDTGVVSVANSNFFDHEIINHTEIQVVASDGGTPSLKRMATVPIAVKILDVNDNAPKFNQSEYNVTVTENVRLNPPLPLLQVNATDEDSGINGNIHYSIIGGNDNDIFLLGVETGILYPHKSLLGQKREFHLTVEARDGGGNGQLYDRATIHIQILNVNEHKPEFVMPSSNATVEVTENAATENYLVITVKAKDDDANDNGKITYHFKVDGQNVQHTNEFSIDPNTGELRTRIFLDREVKAKYELVLAARDHGYPKWFETLSYLTVLLVDINDNRPEFPDSKTTNPYHFFITENENKGARIGQVKALDRDEGNHAKVYYYILSGNEDNSFYLDRSEGSLYTNTTFDREYRDEYNLFILANNDPDFYLTVEEKQKMDQDEIMHDSSIAKVRVTVNDVNDNAPIFEQSVYYAAVNAMANINDFVANVTAFDPDLGPNGSLTYYIKASNLFKYRSNKSSGSIIPSPFNITEMGEISTATYLAENNQHRFVVDIIARENAFPEREAYTQVNVWIFEPEQLIRVILSRPSDEVTRERDEIIAELSNATQSLVIIDEIRYHTDDNGYKNEEWSDMYILVVDHMTQTILPVPEVLKIIDSKYDFLKDYYAGFAIENVVPAFVTEKEESFDPALAALIALLIVLFIGIITFIIVCCCLRHWVISPTDLKKKDALIKKAIIDDLNTTENPLWIEQKLKIYEEQELTMQVFNEPEQNALGRRDSDDFVPDDNTYATIQHPNRRGSSHVASMSLADDLADYATLSGLPHQTDSAHSSLRGAPNYYEAAMGFQGSTFQVPDKMNSSSDYDSYRTRFKGSELTINNDGQPEYVAELI